MEIEYSIKKIVASIEEPKFRDFEVNILNFGAKGDGEKNCHKAFTKALKKIDQKGGGTLIVPKGIYLINGPIHLVSNLNLHLETGSILKFGSNPDDYLPTVKTSWEGTFLYNYSPFIYGYGLNNVAITGKGIIDGEGHINWPDWKEIQAADQELSRTMNHNDIAIEDRQFGKDHFLRPQLVQFFNCSNILVEGIRIEDSPFWCLHMLRSNNITIKNISFDAQNKNNDGIDLEYSSNVLIEGVDFNNGDDNIAIKAGRDTEGRNNHKTPTENVVIRNCKFKGLHALVIGSEMSAGVRNVFVVDNVASGYLKRGIYFKTNSDRGGYIKDIFIKNLKLLDTEDCLYMTANYHGEGSGKHASKISDVVIENVHCLTSSNTAIVIEGYPTSKVENLLLKNITVETATNGVTITNTKNVIMEEVIIGEKAGVPTAAQ